MPPKRKAEEPEENAYGNGGVYPDKTRGGWRWVVPLGHGKTKTGRSMDQNKATTAWKAALEQRDKKLSPQGTTITLAQLVDEYMQNVVAARQVSNAPLAPNTLLDLEKVQNWMLKDWGKYRLSELTARRILEMHTDITKKQSAYVAKRVLTHLHQLLNYAIVWRYVEVNVVAVARDTIPPYVTDDKEPMSDEDATRLLAYLKGTPHFLVYLVGLVYGMRIGELLGLQWDDIDWKKRTIRVQRQVQEINGVKEIRDQAKTKASDRILPLTPHIGALLEAAPHTSVFIFPSRAGTAWLPSDFRKQFGGTPAERITGIRQKAGISPKITPHIFRHTVATRLVDMNVRGEVSDAILGHGKKGVRGRYGHATLETMRKALTELESQLLDSLT